MEKRTISSGSNTRTCLIRRANLSCLLLWLNSYGTGEKPEKIIIRANEDHKYYLKSLPLHHSQRLIEVVGEYADFEFYLAPTYDFVMKLLQVGSMIEVIESAHLRRTMKSWIKDMYELYQND